MNILIIANSESVHTARYANDFVEKGHQVSLLSVMPYLNQSVVYHKNVKHISFMPFTTNLLKRLFTKSFMSFSAEHSKPYHIMNFLIMARLIYMVLFVNRELRNTRIDAVFGMNLTVYGLIAARINRNIPKVCMTLGCDVRFAKWNSLEIITNNKPVYRYLDKHLTNIISGAEQHSAGVNQNGRG